MTTRIPPAGSKPRKKPAKSGETARKRPSQDRSRATVDAILEATARILVREGYEALSTNRVAADAGVSIGSLYQYFPNKEALIAALSERHLDDIERTLTAGAAAVGAKPFADIVRGMIRANVAAHLVDPELHTAISDFVPPQGAHDRRIAFTREAQARVRAILEAYRDDLAVRDLDLAAYMIVRTVEACVHDAYFNRKADMLSGALTAQVEDLVLAYLLGGRVATRPSGAARPRSRG
jgi:AcrR family transcriptional regulator